MALELAGAGRPRPRAVAVALARALRASLAALGPDLGCDLGLHQLGDDPRDRLAQNVGVLGGHQLVDHSEAVILVSSAIVVLLSSVAWS